MSKKPPQPSHGEITIFETEDGRTRVEVRFEHENVWLTQKLMAELYECSADNVSLHLRNIFAERELDEKSVTEESSVTSADGKSYRTTIYTGREFDPAATVEESSIVQTQGSREVTRVITSYRLEASTQSVGRVWRQPARPWVMSEVIPASVTQTAGRFCGDVSHASITCEAEHTRPTACFDLAVSSSDFRHSLF